MLPTFLKNRTNGVLLAGSIVCACTLGEYGARLHGRWLGIDHRLYWKEVTDSNRTPGIFRPHPVLGYELRPNLRRLAVTSDFSVAYTINPQGWRGRAVPVERGPRRRVLALGDSFTFGEGVTERERMTELLAQDLDRELVNLGVPGYSLDQAILAYFEKGRAFHADEVLFFLNGPLVERKPIFELKDGAPVVPDVETSRYLSGGGTLFRRQRSPRPPSFLFYSAFVSWAGHEWTLWRLKDKLAKQDDEIWKNLPYPRWPDSEAPRPHPWRTQVTRSGEVLKWFRKQVEADGARLIVLNIDPHFHFNAIRRPHGENYLDFSQGLSQLAHKHPLRFTYDKHFNASTHRFLGKRIAHRLRNLGGFHSKLP